MQFTLSAASSNTVAQLYWVDRKWPKETVYCRQSRCTETHMTQRHSHGLRCATNLTLYALRTVVLCLLWLPGEQGSQEFPACCRIMSDGYILQCGNSTVAVDYWTAPHAAAFFLTHLHADHYKGLHNDWCLGTIYCSELTRLLLLQKWPRLRAKVVPIEQPIVLQLRKDDSLAVTAIPANHCPVRKPVDC